MVAEEHCCQQVAVAEHCCQLVVEVADRLAVEQEKDRLVVVEADLAVGAGVLVGLASLFAHQLLSERAADGFREEHRQQKRRRLQQQQQQKRRRLQQQQRRRRQQQQ